MPAEGCSGHVDSVPRHGAGSGKRRHPVVRLVRRMLAHRRVIGFTCIVAAVLWLLAFPLACISCGELKCRGTYIGENALQVHSGKRAFGDKTAIHGAGEHMRWLRDAAISWHVNVSAALHQSQRVQGRAVSVPASAAVSAKWFFQELQDLGIETTMQQYGNGSATNVVAVVRGSASSQQREAMVLASRYPIVIAAPPTGVESSFDVDTATVEAVAAYERGHVGGAFVNLALARYFASGAVQWLSKDIVFVFGGGSLDGCTTDAHAAVGSQVHGGAVAFDACACCDAAVRWSVRSEPLCGVDSRLGYAAHYDDIEAFMRAVVSSHPTDRLPGGNPRFGTVRAALYLHMPHLSRVSSLALEPQGHGASLPNMDYFNAAEAMFDPVGRGSRAGLATPHDGLAWVQRVVGLPATLAARLFMSPPSAQLYGERLATTARFALRMVVGPWSPHSPFLDHAIDALTVSTVPPSAHSAGLARPVAARARLKVERTIAKGVEGVVRAVSNLDERLHQSYWLYLLPDTHLFVSIGEYCYPGVLLVSVFMLAAAAQRATIPSLAKAAIALLTAVAACMFARALIASFGGHNNRQEAPALQFNVLAFVVVHVGLLGVAEYGTGTVVIRLLGHRSSKTKPSLETTTVSSFALLVCCYATCTLAVCGIINFPVGCSLLLLLAPACVLVMPTPIEDASRRLTFARCPLPQLAKLWLALSSPCGVAVAVTAGSLWEHWAQHPGVGVMDSVFGRSAANPLTPVAILLSGTFARSGVWVPMPALAMWVVWMPIHTALAVLFTLQQSAAPQRMPRSR